MSDNFLIIAILALGALVLGVVLYFPIRWVMLRSVPQDAESRKVEPKDLLYVIAILGVLITLVWFREAGNKTAAGIVAAITILAPLAGIYLLNRSKAKDNEPDDT